MFENAEHSMFPHYAEIYDSITAWWKALLAVSMILNQLCTGAVRPKCVLPNGSRIHFLALHGFLLVRDVLGKFWLCDFSHIIRDDS